MKVLAEAVGVFQLTADAEIKVVQSRELLDTIVKENKGEDARTRSAGPKVGIRVSRVR